MHPRASMSKHLALARYQSITRMTGICGRELPSAQGDKSVAGADECSVPASVVHSSTAMLLAFCRSNQRRSPHAYLPITSTCGCHSTGVTWSMISSVSLALRHIGGTLARRLVLFSSGSTLRLNSACPSDANPRIVLNSSHLATGLMSSHQTLNVRVLVRDEGSRSHIFIRPRSNYGIAVIV